MKKVELNKDSAMVLQQIEEDELEDFESLNESLRFGRSYTLHILQNLQHKGLIIMQDSWISLSSKGKKTITTYVPHFNKVRESHPLYNLQ